MIIFFVGIVIGKFLQKRKRNNALAYIDCVETRKSALRGNWGTGVIKEDKDEDAEIGFATFHFP